VGGGGGGRGNRWGKRGKGEGEGGWPFLKVWSVRRIRAPPPKKSRKKKEGGAIRPLYETHVEVAGEKQASGMRKGTPSIVGRGAGLSTPERRVDRRSDCAMEGHLVRRDLGGMLAGVQWGGANQRTTKFGLLLERTNPPKKPNPPTTTPPQPPHPTQNKPHHPPPPTPHHKTTPPPTPTPNQTTPPHPPTEKKTQKPLAGVSAMGASNGGVLPRRFPRREVIIRARKGVRL